MFNIYRGSPLTRFQLHIEVPTSAIEYTVNIYWYKTIEANGNTNVIPTTYQQITTKKWQFIYRGLRNSQCRLKDLLVVGMTPVFPLAAIVFYL